MYYLLCIQWFLYICKQVLNNIQIYPTNIWWYQVWLYVHMICDKYKNVSFTTIIWRLEFKNKIEFEYKNNLH